MVSGIQLLGILFGLTTSYFTYVNFKRREFTVREFLGWEAVWVSFVIATIFPEQFRVLAFNLGTIRALDLFTFFGFVLVLSISFYTYVYVDRLRKRLEKTIRDLALSEVGGQPASQQEERSRKKK